MVMMSLNEFMTSANGIATVPFEYAEQMKWYFYGSD